MLPILIDHLFSLLLFLYDVGCKLMLTRIGQETNWLLKIGLNIFGSVRFWTKINNQTNFFFFEPNRTENRFKPINFGSVRFFPLPNRFKPKLFQLVHIPKKSLHRRRQRKNFLVWAFWCSVPKPPTIKIRASKSKAYAQ